MPLCQGCLHAIEVPMTELDPWSITTCDYNLAKTHKFELSKLYLTIKHKFDLNESKTTPLKKFSLLDPLEVFRLTG